MAGKKDNQAVSPRCNLCPAGCRLQLASSGPDAWRIEYPLAEASGLCPRGACLGELLSHPHRILTATRRRNGSARELSLRSALREILDHTGSNGLTILLDGNIPCEQLIAVGESCKNLPRTKLCFVVEPTDEQLLLGTDAAAVDYLSADQFVDCDGFLIVGDPFAANPICSRGVFDRRAIEPQTPVVVIDPAAGTGSKFATHVVEARAGMELSVLSAVAAGVGLDPALPGLPDPSEIPSGVDAGKALAGCKRLGVLIAAEYGRPTPWRQIGYLTGRIAHELAGGVAPQTVGANTLAAVRIGTRLGTVSLAEALTDETGIRIAIGSDVLGMLGWGGSTDEKRPEIIAAAAPLPNCTTEAAEFVLPVALAGEIGGTCILDGINPVLVSPLLPPPAGVPSPAELVAALVEEGGVPPGQIPQKVDLPARVETEQPAGAEAWADPPDPVLLLGREASDSGCGALTGHASWGRGMTEAAELRVSVDCAEKANLKNLSEVNVQAGGQVLRGRIRISPELPRGTVVFPEGVPQARALLPSRIDRQKGLIVSAPVTVSSELLT